MKSPKLYTIRKFKFRDIIDSNYKFKIPYQDRKKYNINQQDNMLFRQIRLITNDNRKFNKYIVFVDCKGCKSKTKELKHIIQNGFFINKQHFILSEKSASMSRNAILGFIDKSIYEDVDKAITMDISMDKTVISKYLAYRGLMFSSCFNLEDWIPKIIVVDDYIKIIKNQHVKYVTDKHTEFIDKETGEKRVWKEKDIVDGYQDIEVNIADGCGIHHPLITKTIKEKINIEENPTSVMWRAPFIKGVTHEFDYEQFFNERNVYKITDIFGIEHNFNEPMIIITVSMYKGLKYFKEYGDVRDWHKYWEKFKKYNHCLGIAKWNYSFENEPLYTRANYQILQDLKLDYDDFYDLTFDSIDWTNKIINGDKVYTYCFLGMFADKYKPKNDYVRAILKNQEMLKDECVRKYFNDMLKKYIDHFKCGKLWLKGSFRTLTPDLIMLAEHIGGLEPKGCLNGGEFYSVDNNGVCEGEHLIERNPHISHAEHVILNGVNNELIKKYCSHLSNIVMINGYDVIDARLNGSDKDGDLCLVIKNDIMMDGVDRSKLFVVDIEDKITAKEVEISAENIAESIILSMDNRIGEYSNVASCYHNKCPQSQEQAEKYEKYIDLVSILNAKEIDYAKCGVRFNLPKYIAKYAKPLPYFMKYAGKYYKNMKRFNKSRSNMNKLCRDLEKWSKLMI